MTTPIDNQFLSNGEIALRIVVSIVLSGMIGLERKFYHKPAGFRTNILVGLGATILMLLALQIFTTFNDAGIVDPSRIAAQVVTGIGFLGAGAIIQGRGSIHGMTTAASIWVVAAIGMAVGMGFYFTAVIATLAALLVLVVMGRLEFRFEKRRNGKGETNDEITNREV